MTRPITRTITVALVTLALLPLAIPAPRGDQQPDRPHLSVIPTAARHVGELSEGSASGNAVVGLRGVPQGSGSHPGGGGVAGRFGRLRESPAPQLPQPSATPAEPQLGVAATTPAGPRAAGTFLPLSRTDHKAVPRDPRQPARKEVPTDHGRAIQPRVAATTSGGLTHRLSGRATWFCLPGRSACTRGYQSSGAYAAAGPQVRAALGDWRGRTVRVVARGASVEVRLIDWCSCPGGRLLDLYASAFAQLAPHGLSDGVIDVAVEWEQ